MKRITSFLLAIVLFTGLVLTAAPTAHAASEMKASDALVEVLKKEEGFSAKPYWDYAQYTVGYGTRCPDDMFDEYSKNGISEEDADILLRNYLSATENTINKKFIDAYGLTLTQGQFDALITFTYNCGSGWINKTGDRFFNAVKNGATGSELINAFALWCTAGGQILPGLVRRRLCEANMFLNGEYSTTKPSNYGYVYYNGNGGSVPYRIQGYDANEGVAPAYTPTYNGATFLGWFTDKTAGEQVTVLTEALSGKTLYARWEGVPAEGETPAAPASVTVKVTANEVNLRKGPGTNYGIVGSANAGEEMTITETASGSGYEWGKAGDKWIALKYTNYSEAVKAPEQKPEETTPETTAPETTVPETTAPETTVPETTVPETTAPETTVPETTAPAATEQTGTVKANGGLSVRKGPGTGYERVKYLDNGSKVTILEQQKAGSMTWGRISDGWISMSYVVLGQGETTPPETTAPESTAPSQTATAGTVKADGGLSLRQGPGTGYARIRYLANGTKVNILEQKDGWGRISDGWISMTYVALDQSGTTSAPETTQPETTAPETTTTQTGTVKVNDSLSVRNGAGTNNAVKRYLTNGTKVTVTEIKDVSGAKWGNIGDGWVCLDYVVMDGQSQQTPADSKTVTADCLRVREAPSTSARIVGYYYQGAKVQIGETQDAEGTTWGKTPKGWVSMAYIK